MLRVLIKILMVKQFLTKNQSFSMVKGIPITLDGNGTPLPFMMNEQYSLTSI